MIDLENIICLGHSTIKIKNKKEIIYFDPYNISEEYKDASVIFITHSHYDHFSEKDILKVKRTNTCIVITKDLYDRTIELGFPTDKIICVEPNGHYEVSGISFSTVPAYNLDKDFHPKENGWVGYILELDSIKYYIAGDTDVTEENKRIDCDVLFLPVGAKYTMDALEASHLANRIRPKIAIPIHYGVIVGKREDAEKFKKNIEESIRCEIMY